MEGSLVDNPAPALQWGTACLVSKGYSIERAPEIVLATPWSTIMRFTTATGDFYLKQTPPAISKEPQIVELLSDQLHASVPIVIASNDALHCFLMQDAGNVLRATLKTKFNPELLCRAIKEYAAIQRSTEDH